MTDMLAFFMGWSWNGGGGGQVGGGDPSSDRGQGGPATQGRNVPLPPAQDTALQATLGSLQKLKPSAKCEAKVINKLDGFSFTAFQDYLSEGGHFYDGTSSTVPAASTIYPALAAATVSRLDPSVTTMASLFARDPGLNAITSMVTQQFTAYFRPSAIDLSRGGINSRNRGLLFHEALHGYGMGTGLYDQGLISAFRLSGPSGSISAYISRNCQ